MMVVLAMLTLAQTDAELWYARENSRKLDQIQTSIGEIGKVVARNDERLTSVERDLMRVENNAKETLAEHGARLTLLEGWRIDMMAKISLAIGLSSLLAGVVMSIVNRWLAKRDHKRRSKADG